MTDLAVSREKKALDSEKNMSRKALSFQRKKIAEELLGGMGKDMEDVLSGKVKVRLPFFTRLKYKINFFVNKIFKSL